MIHSSWGPPEVPSSPSKPCMSIKVSRPVLFSSTVSERPASELAHSQHRPLDLPYGVNCVTFPLGHSPEVEFTPLAHDMAAWLPGDSVRKGLKDSRPVVGLGRAESQWMNQSRQLGQDRARRRGEGQKGHREGGCKHGGESGTPRFRKTKLKNNSPYCLCCRSGSPGCTPGSCRSLWWQEMS